MHNEKQEIDESKNLNINLEESEDVMGPFKSVEELMKNTWDSED